MKRLTAIPFDTAGATVANVAMAIRGSCCLQQNHDFRFIDPGDPKIGLSSTNQMDDVVSTEFSIKRIKTSKGKRLRSSSSSFGQIQALLEFTGPATKILAKPGDNPVRLVTKWLMLFPEGKPGVLKLPQKTRGGSACMSQ